MIKKLKINFKENNSFCISVDCNLKEYENLIFSISDNKNEFYIACAVYNIKLTKDSYSVANFVKCENGKAIINCYPGKFFKYKIKIISQIDDKLEIIKEEEFNINKHQFYLFLNSDNDQEIEIWKNYIKLVESILSIKINYIINDIFNTSDDIIEISKNRYDNYIKESETPLRNDYSSLTIIKTLFDIL